MRAKLAAAVVAAMALSSQSPALAQTASAVPATPQHANAQEQAPNALLGAWKVDLGRSKYGGAAPKNNIRTFSYTQDGKLLVTSISLGATGRKSMLHWAVQLDGSPSPEFTDYNGSTPSSVVGLKKQDETTLVLTVWKHGKVTLTGSFKLSPDGETLTYVYGATGGENVIVYKRWDMAG
jgi:hypothetical protein